MQLSLIILIGKETLHFILKYQGKYYYRNNIDK